MLFRKIERVIREYFSGDDTRIMIVTGARQIGKSYIIRHVGEEMFQNYVEINLEQNEDIRTTFSGVRSLEDFHLALGTNFGTRLGGSDDTLVFIDEIQTCPNLLTLLKFLREEGRYRYIASGSLLEVSLRQTHSIPVGSITIKKMYPLDFEEFLIANAVGPDIIRYLEKCLMQLESPMTGVHDRIMTLFRRYLLTGGLPQAVNEFIATRNLARIRAIQQDVYQLYIADASKYGQEHRLHIARIYEMIPSNMENKKKRLVYKDIEGKKGKRSHEYEEDMEYLVSSGVALEVKAISNPKFPLAETAGKNLLKLYLNDAGLLSDILYGLNPRPILEDVRSINLGALYECVVATQLAANGCLLYYYDNRKNGEVDFLFDDFASLSAVPVEVKSGRDYKIHSALSRFVNVPDYLIERGYVLSDSGKIEVKGPIVYVPVYMVMFFRPNTASSSPILI